MALAWQRDGERWRGLVRFARVVPAGFALTYKHWVEGGELVERAGNDGRVGGWEGT